MDPAIANPSASPATAAPHYLLATGLRFLRTSFAEESVDPRALWFLAAEGLAAWVRYVERALGEHLDDRDRARLILAAAVREMCLRRVAALDPPLSKELAGAAPAEVRAFFEALYPGPIAGAVRWSLAGIDKEQPSSGDALRAWRRVLNMDARTRWLEVSHHLGELAIVLTERLPEHKVPRAIGWLGDVCYAFGKEVGELCAELFGMPETTYSAIETLRMGELLFRVNPEHSSGSDKEQGTGYIEGNACLWYKRPGWGPVHCGVLGRFQAGISEVFGLSYTLAQTIPKHGGSTCRINLAPIQIRTGAAPSKKGPGNGASGWQSPTGVMDSDAHAASLAALAQGRDPGGGFFGPETLMWECTRESILLLGGGRAALMQLAHPAVAHAIRDHSTVHHDMLGRFMRTMASAYAVLFGSVDEALSISERVHHIHSAIWGQLDDVPGQEAGRYHALDAEAAFWVGATLFDTSTLVYEQMVRPFTPAQRDRLVREAGPFWGLFGVPAAACPTTWADLHGYVVRRVESLAPLVGDTARNQAALLFTSRVPFLQPIFDQVRLIVAHMLPASLSCAFGMKLGSKDRMLARTWLFAAELLLPWFPPRLRYVPAYHRALRRLRQATR